MSQANPLTADEIAAELKLLKTFRATALATAGGSTSKPAERAASVRILGRLDPEIDALERAQKSNRR